MARLIFRRAFGIDRFAWRNFYRAYRIGTSHRISGVMPVPVGPSAWTRALFSEVPYDVTVDLELVDVRSDASLKPLQGECCRAKGIDQPSGRFGLQTGGLRILSFFRFCQ